MNCFNIHLVKRNIARFGRSFSFCRAVKNNFGENTSETVAIHRLRGIFHNSRGGYSALKVSEETAVREKKQPMIICLFSDTDKLLIGDIVGIGGRQYKLTAIDDIDSQGELAEISLEMIV